MRSWRNKSPHSGIQLHNSQHPAPWGEESCQQNRLTVLFEALALEKKEEQPSHRYTSVFFKHCGEHLVLFKNSSNLPLSKMRMLKNFLIIWSWRIFFVLVGQFLHPSTWWPSSLFGHLRTKVFSPFICLNTVYLIKVVCKN